MKISELLDKLSLEVLSLEDKEREINGCYCSDLLSHCMSNIDYGNIWVTVQVNINIVAIAVLTDPSAIIISQEMQVRDDVISKAKEEGINLFRSKLPSYELCKELGRLI